MEIEFEKKKSIRSDDFQLLRNYVQNIFLSCAYQYINEKNTHIIDRGWRFSAFFRNRMPASSCEENSKETSRTDIRGTSSLAQPWRSVCTHPYAECRECCSLFLPYPYIAASQPSPTGRCRESCQFRGEWRLSTGAGRLSASYCLQQGGPRRVLCTLSQQTRTSCRQLAQLLPGAALYI